MYEDAVENVLYGLQIIVRDAYVTLRLLDALGLEPTDLRTSCGCMVLGLSRDSEPKTNCDIHVP